MQFPFPFFRGSYIDVRLDFALISGEVGGAVRQWKMGRLRLLLEKMLW
jgi:hypothetical protein